MTTLHMPRLSPLALFHWRAAVPGAAILAVIAAELCAAAIFLSKAIAP